MIHLNPKNLRVRVLVLTGLDPIIETHIGGCIYELFSQV
jgi:hypothetical protein